LRIRDIEKFNISLLARWVWRIGEEGQGLWKKVNVSKYSIGGKICVDCRNRYDSWWWTDVCKICGEGKPENWFDKAIQWRIGMGDKIQFWNDIWVRNQPLNDFFSRFVTFSNSYDNVLSEIGE